MNIPNVNSPKDFSIIFAFVSWWVGGKNDSEATLETLKLDMKVTETQYCILP